MDETLLDSRSAAVVLGVSRRTLEAWRAAGRGPRYQRIGVQVVYVARDLAQFLTERSAPRGRAQSRPSA